MSFATVDEHCGGLECLGAQEEQGYGVEPSEPRLSCG